MRKLKKLQYGGFNQFQSYGNVLQSQYNFNNSMNNMINSLYGIDNTKTQLGPNSWMTAGNASNGFQSTLYSKDSMGNTTNWNTGKTTYNTNGLSAGLSGDENTKGINSISKKGGEGAGGETGSNPMAGMNPFGAIGGAFDSLTPMTGVKIDEDSTYNAEQKTGDMLLQMGGWAALAGGIVKTNSFLNQAMGTNINTMNDKQAKKVGANDWEKFGNTAVGFLSNTLLPGTGAFFGKTEDAEKSREVDELRGAYAGTADDIDTAQTMGGKRYIFGKGKANNFILKSNQRNDLITSLGLATKPRITSAASNARDEMQKEEEIRNERTFNTVVGKEGLKLLSKDELQRIYSSSKQEGVQTFGEGGKIGIDTSVIPEGALHAHKNNLEEINPELDEVTQKGIPVIVTDSEGEYKQVAEIEKEELVLNRSLTEKIEALWKENTPESMIEAGKLITCELVQNTKDNTEEMLDGND